MRWTPEPSPVIPMQRGGARPNGHLIPVPRQAADRWVESVPDPAVPAPAADRGALAAETDLRELRGIVHDLGNGLSTMALLLEAARTGSVPTFGLLELMEQETNRLLAVVHSGTGPAEPGPAEPVDVRAVLRPIAWVAAHTGETSVRMVPGPGLVARVDPIVLARVVTNLVDNAVRAAGPAGAVRIGVQRAGSSGQDVVIDVLDDGPGFPLGPPGRGRLGLDLVDRLLATCGGRLELGDAGPRGTRARVVLPGHATDQPPPAAA